jgi:hypothetical protein
MIFFSLWRTPWTAAETHQSVRRYFSDQTMGLRRTRITVGRRRSCGNTSRTDKVVALLWKIHGRRGGSGKLGQALS